MADNNNKDDHERSHLLAKHEHERTLKIQQQPNSIDQENPAQQQHQQPAAALHVAFYGTDSGIHSNDEIIPDSSSPYDNDEDDEEKDMQQQQQQQQQHPLVTSPTTTQNSKTPKTSGNRYRKTAAAPPQVNHNHTTNNVKPGRITFYDSDEEEDMSLVGEGEEQSSVAGMLLQLEENGDDDDDATTNNDNDSLLSATNNGEADAAGSWFQEAKKIQKKQFASTNGAAAAAATEYTVDPKTGRTMGVITHSIHRLANTKTTVSNDFVVAQELENTPMFGSTLLLANYMSEHRDRVLKSKVSSAELLMENDHSDADAADAENAAIMAKFSRRVSRAVMMTRTSMRSIVSIGDLDLSAIDEGGGAEEPTICQKIVTAPAKFMRSHFTSGSLQQGIVASMIIALVNGVACWVYYSALEWCLEFFWRTLPETYFTGTFLDASQYGWMWIPIVSFVSCILVGLVVQTVGEPGDLAFTVACVHKKAYIPLDHVHPMVLASQFSILAGGSLGPEAPLVAICGALAGFVSQQIMGERYRAVARKHTLMGMAGALSAFFGIPLGGSLFALEVNSRFGVEYYEHVTECIFCGELTLVVFRTLANLSIQPLWNLGKAPDHCDVWKILLGATLGLVGAALAYLFAVFHWQVMKVFSHLGLLDNKRAILRAMLGGTGIILIGLFIPQTMFWSEIEFQPLVMREPASHLPHVWPTTGVMNFEMDATWKVFLTGLLKLAAISFTVAGGLRGGYIFPLMCAGGLVGRAIADWFGLPAPLCILSVAAGINTAITRTVLATPIILCSLPGINIAAPIVLMASLTSLFASSTLGFIKTQMARSDLEHHMFHSKPTKPPESPLHQKQQQQQQVGDNSVTSFGSIRRKAHKRNTSRGSIPSVVMDHHH